MDHSDISNKKLKTLLLNSIELPLKIASKTIYFVRVLYNNFNYKLFSVLIHFDIVSTYILVYLNMNLIGYSSEWINVMISVKDHIVRFSFV